jgi:Ser/Thr protein kinase RdoA (MazF antagonist)
VNGIKAFAEQALGPCTTEQDCSWAHRGPSVLRLRDAEGLVWYAKRHRYAHLYDQELTAYRRWVPALGEGAPTLRAFDGDLSALLLSEVPGTIALDVRSEACDVTALHRQAAALLRRFHQAEEPSPAPDFAVRKRDELDRWVSRADGYLDRRELDFVRSELRALEGVTGLEVVPCHLDYSPRNWLVERDRVYVIDFEWSVRDFWANDLGKLFFGWWRTQPEQEEAFLDGYGRALAATDRAVLLGSYALTATWHTIWAYTHDNPVHGARCREILQGLMRREYG